MPIPRRFPALVALVLASLLHAGCVVTRTLEPTYTPRPVEELRQIPPRRVFLDVADERPADERQWVATGGKVRFVTRPEPLALFRDSLGAGLRHNGHGIAPAPGEADLRIHLRVTRIWHEVKDAGMELEKTMMVNAEVELSAPGAASPHARIPVRGFYRRSIPLVASGSVTPGFEAALADAVNQLLVDQRFLRALAAR